MKRSPCWTGIRTRGFTLVEMLVSATVLVLVMVLLLQLLRNATATISFNRGRMDADATARMVFDRMASDFATMIKRTDVDIVCSNASGNDNLFFFSEAPAYFGGATNNSTVAIIGYRINNTAPYCSNAPALERLGKGLLRDGAGSDPGSMVFLAYSNTNSTTALSGSLQATWPAVFDDSFSDSAYHVLSSQVFRMEILYLLKAYQKTDGTLAPAQYSLHPWNETHTAVNGFQDVSAIVVTIAVLDDTSRKMIPNVSDGIAAMRDKLLDPTASDISSSPPKLPAQTWREAVQGHSFAPTGVPVAAASQVRIYQRHFYLK